MDDDTICVMGSLSTSRINFNLLWTTFSHYWNSKLIQELLAGRVDHTASPEFEHERKNNHSKHLTSKTAFHYSHCSFKAMSLPSPSAL